MNTQHATSLAQNDENLLQNPRGVAKTRSFTDDRKQLKKIAPKKSMTGHC